MSAESKKAHNFIQSLIEEAIAKGEHTGKVYSQIRPGLMHPGKLLSTIRDAETQ